MVAGDMAHLDKSVDSGLGGEYLGIPFWMFRILSAPILENDVDQMLYIHRSFLTGLQL